MKKTEFTEIKIPEDLLKKVRVIVDRSDCFETVREFVLTAFLQNLIRAVLDAAQAPSSDQ